MRKIAALFSLLIWLVTGVSCAASPAAPAATPTPTPGAPQPAFVDVTKITPAEAAARVIDPVATGTHDPVIIKDQKSGRYYLFATGQGIPVSYSDDLKNWTYWDKVFPRKPDWISTAVPEANDLWAPDVKFYNGKYYLYYAASSFGKNLSAIGLATNATLDPKSPDFKWEDQGLVLQSQPGDDFNAIDPNMTFNENGQPWLAYGSFWTGIKLRKLDPQTGKLAQDDTTIYSIANRLLSPAAIEGAYIQRIGKYFYLFVSHDFCCRGVDSTYKIMVGRAEKITGPYLDKDGMDMKQDGGLLVLAGGKRWKGPGHNSILVDGSHYYLVYHAYDAQDGGRPYLRIEELYWDKDGWPVAPSAIINAQEAK